MTVDLKDFGKVPPAELEADCDFYASIAGTPRQYRLALIRLPKALRASSLSGLSLNDGSGTDDCIGSFDSNGIKYAVRKSIFDSQASLVMPEHGIDSDSGIRLQRT